MPDEPVLFIKPSTCASDFTEPMRLPQGQGECHNEVELAVLINKPLKNANKQQAMESIWGVGIGLDLTLRDVQTRMKKQGLPWERAKAFDNACPLTRFVPFDQVKELENLQFELKVNNEIRQSGHCQHMIWNTVNLLVEISQHFTLLPGDVVMTGTPKGVAALYSDDKLEVGLAGYLTAATSVL